MRARSRHAQDVPADGVVLTKATIRAAEKLGISQKALARIIGVSEPVVSRMKNGSHTLEKSFGKPFELAVLFVRLYRSLDAIVGGDEAVAAAWISNSNAALVGNKPIDLMQTVSGLVHVINYLDSRRAHG